MLKVPTAFTSPGWTAEDTPRFADWIEAAALADPTEDLSRSDLVDAIEEASGGGIPQDDIRLFVDDAISHLRMRRGYLSDMHPVDFHDDRLALDENCKDPIPYSFCLVLSLAPLFPSWRDKHIRQMQRNMFEELTAHIVSDLFPRWTINQTGWANSKGGKGKIVQKIIQLFHARRGGYGEVLDTANDGQIDVIVHRPFIDSRGSYPGYFVQCATGATDLKTKALEPNLGLWEMAVSFLHVPQKALAIPFAIGHDTFNKMATAGRGLVLDRVRLVGSLERALPQAFSGRAKTWIARALSDLPRAT